MANEVPVDDDADQANGVPDDDNGDAKKASGVLDDMADEEDRKKWSEDVLEQTHIGIFTLVYLHRKPRTNEAALWTQFLLLSTIVVQVTTPIVLLLTAIDSYDAENYENGKCPSKSIKADAKTRVLAFMVGLLYVAKLNFLFAEKTSQKLKFIRHDADNLRCLRIMVMIDSHMNMTYEGLVYLINLWIVFVTIEPLDMVLNALALEFILQLDDEVKRTYVGTYFRYENINQRYRDTFLLTDGPDQEDAVGPYGKRLVFPCTLIVFSGVYMFLFYLPICKPGDASSS